MRTMKLKTLILGLMVIGLASCGSDSSEALTLNFKMVYDDEPLVMFSPYTYPDGREIEFSRVSFYLSDFQLTDEDGVASQISEVAYLDLSASHSDLAKAQTGLDYTIEFDESMNYESLSFNFGLTDAQNATTPEDYNSSSPLSLSGEYWSNWGSYVYVKVEGRIDLDGDGISDGFALHLGSETARRNLTLDNLGSAASINLEMDLYRLFDNDGEVYDIDANPRIHSLNQLDQTDLLMDNFMSSMSFDY